MRLASVSVQFRLLSLLSDQIMMKDLFVWAQLTSICETHPSSEQQIVADCCCRVLPLVWLTSVKVRWDEVNRWNKFIRAWRKILSNNCHTPAGTNALRQRLIVLDQSTLGVGSELPTSVRFRRVILVSMLSSLDVKGEWKNTPKHGWENKTFCESKRNVYNPTHTHVRLGWNSLYATSGHL